jgi:AraC-like DNA-binding protein
LFQISKFQSILVQVSFSNDYVAYAFPTTGISLYQYILRCSIERAKTLLLRSLASIAAIAEALFLGESSIKANLRSIAIAPSIRTPFSRHSKFTKNPRFWDGL